MTTFHPFFPSSASKPVNRGGTGAIVASFGARARIDRRVSASQAPKILLIGRGADLNALRNLSGTYRPTKR
jgi:hypothetical protein